MVVVAGTTAEEHAGRAGAAAPAPLHYPDLGATVHRDAVPEGLADELPQLYGSLLSTVDWFLAQDRKRPNGACVLDAPRHVVLFRHDGGTVDVLNRAFSCEPAEADRICRALFRAFPGVHRVHFDVPFDPSKLAFPLRVVERVSHMVIDLPDSVDAYYASLGKSTRRTLRSARNRLRRDFPDVHTEVVEPGPHCRPVVDQLIDWKVQRFRAQGRRTYWETNAGLSERTADLLRRCGQIRVTTIAGEEAAIHFCFRVGSTAYALEGAHDPAYDDHRLGFLTMYETVCAAIESGAVRFNALEGTAGPKALLGARPVRFTRLSVFRSRVSRLRSLDEALVVARRDLRTAVQRRRHALGQRVRGWPGGDVLARLVRRRRVRRWDTPHEPRPPE